MNTMITWHDFLVRLAGAARDSDSTAVFWSSVLQELPEALEYLESTAS